MEQFRIYHQKSTTYHLQENGIVEAFNKILETMLIKICNVQTDAQDQRNPIVSWSYMTTSKRLTDQTPFRLVYGKEAIIPMEFIIPSLRIVAKTNLMEENEMHESLEDVMELEEGRFITRFHQIIQKAQQKAWHDRHIKRRSFNQETCYYYMIEKF